MLMRFCQLGICVLFFIFISNTSCQAEHITISSPAIPPVSGEGESPGYLKNILQEAGKRIGLEINFLSMPAKRSLVSSNQGKTDGELHRIEGLEKYYPNLIRVPEPVLIDQFVGFSIHKGITVKDWHNTGDLLVSYPRGWTIYAKTFGVDAEHQPGLNGHSLFHMLEKGRIDIAMHTLDKGTYIAAKEGVKVHPIKPVFSIQPMYVYLHKSKGHLIEKLAASIAQVKKDGTYARIKREILHSYGLKDKAYFQSPLDKPGS